MKKRILSLIASAVLILVAVIGLQNEKVVEAADNMVLLEKRHPGYWNWLHKNAEPIKIDQNGENKVTVYPVSKLFLSDIRNSDYQIFLRYISGGNRSVIYFLDGTGFDVANSLYGSIVTGK